MYCSRLVFFFLPKGSHQGFPKLQKKHLYVAGLQATTHIHVTDEMVLRTIQLSSLLLYFSNQESRIQHWNSKTPGSASMPESSLSEKEQDPGLRHLSEHLKEKQNKNIKLPSKVPPFLYTPSVFVTSCPTRQAVTDDFAFSGWSTVSSARHLPCPLVTRVQVWVVLGWGKFKCFRPKTRQWLILGAEPEASGQGPSTPLCLKLQLQKQAAGRPHPGPCQCICGPLQASWSLLSGSLRVRGGDTNSTSHPAGPRR